MQYGAPSTATCVCFMHGGRCTAHTRLCLFHASCSTQASLHRPPCKTLSSVEEAVRGVRGALVACVVPPGAVSMLLPRAEAQPAELVAALTARHVHAALVLLDRALALWARLRVGNDPREVLALGAVLYGPLPHSFAVDGAVSLVLAGEAERAAAFAEHVQRPAAIQSCRGLHWTMLLLCHCATTPIVAKQHGHMR